MKFKKLPKAARHGAEFVAAEEDHEDVGEHHSYYFFRTVSMSFKTMKRLSFPAQTFVLNRSITTHGSLKKFILSSLCDAEAASSTVSRETAMEASSTSARAGHFVAMLERIRDGTVRQSVALFWTVAAVKVVAP